MIREIKFRAWDKQTGRWTSNILVDLTSPVVNSYITLMQYTGLKDRNGVEIYEGDICKYYDSVPADQKAFDDARWPDEYNDGWVDKVLIGKVEFKEFGFWVGGTRWFDKKTKVIGNIYENPELLNDQ